MERVFNLLVFLFVLALFSEDKGRGGVWKREYRKGNFWLPPLHQELTAQKRLKRSLKRQMLGNTHLWMKSKTKNLIVSLYKSAVYHIWNSALSFGLPASTELLHKLRKGNREAQELRSCYCAQEVLKKKHGREEMVTLHYSHLKNWEATKLRKSVTVHRWNCETWSYIMVREPK